MKKILLENYYIALALILFASIFIVKIEFYKIIILLLEFIVILEVLKMISDFIKNKRLKLRVVIDMFIIFLIRDVIILTTYPEKSHQNILFLLFVIFIFFIFRILTIYFSPSNTDNSL